MLPELMNGFEKVQANNSMQSKVFYLSTATEILSPNDNSKMRKECAQRNEISEKNTEIVCLQIINWKH